jgi:peroxiredoxin
MIEQGKKGSRYSRGMSPLLLMVLFVALSFLAFTFLGRIHFQEKKVNPPAGRDLFKRLSIEKPEKVMQAPDFTLEDPSGKRLGLKDLKGKVVFLSFWATWCVPCREEMPLMEKLQREFREQGLEIVAVNFREDKKTVRQFFAELGLSFTSLADENGKVGEEYGAWSLPLTYLIDRNGDFIGKAIGDRRWDSEDARAFFRDLLRQKN